MRRISLDTPDQTDVIIPLDGIKEAVAMDWDSQGDYIYWTDVTQDTINRARWDGTGQETIVRSSLESPAGLAVDWVTNKLYWTDAGTDYIEVSNLDGTMRTVLVWEGLDRPRDIIVDPLHGYMYWTDWGSTPKIERAGMDGLDRSELVNSNLTWPNGLAIDYKTSRLYWVDAGRKTIEFLGLDGKGRTTLIGKNLPHPFGLTLYDDKVYWTDWQTKSIHVANLADGSGATTIRTGLESLMDIHMFHRNRKQVLNTCQINNGECSHLCLIAPQPRGHTCACPTGITISSNGQQCETKMKHFLLFARRIDIRTIPLGLGYYADVVVPIRNLKNAIAVDYDTESEKIYWSDSVLDKIQRSNLDGSDVEDVISNGLDTTDGIAVDPIGRKLYWTDTGLDHIEVANLDGSMRKVLVWQDLKNPRAIAVHHNAGYLFWTDWGANPRIERSDMDGKNRRTIVRSVDRKHMGWPNGLSIDYVTNRIIWVDAMREKIECADLNGDNRQVLVNDVPHPYGLTVSGEFIYWTDWQTKAIHRADKRTGENKVAIRNNLARLMDIKAANEATFGTNKCGSNNGGCSHLCLPKPEGFTCACPTGLLLKEDGKTCHDLPSKYLLFASRSSIRRISLDTDDHTDVYLPLPNLQGAIALDYDYAGQKLYYTDVILDVIRRADLNGSNMETIIEMGLVTADGLAVDWIAQNLYWTDTGHGRNVIEVSRLDGTSRKVLLSERLDEPRAIAVYPEKGLMFWSDWGEVGKIEKSFLDGSGRISVVSDNLGWPNGLTIDKDLDRIFWADAQLDRIETSDLNGDFRVQLVDKTTHPFGITVYGPHVYWTDWQTKSIEKVDKMTGHNRETILGNMENLMDVHMVAADKQTGTNACSYYNGGCTHLCLARLTSYVCACPDKPDHRPCSTEPRSINHIPHGTGKPGDKDWNENPLDTGQDECSEEDMLSGKCNSSSGQVHGAYITLGVVLMAILVGIIIAILIWKRQRRRREAAEAALEASLTFSNPTYHKTSDERINIERRVKPWRLFRYDKNEERLSMLGQIPQEEKINNQEAAARVKQRELESEQNYEDVDVLVVNRNKDKNYEPDNKNFDKNCEESESLVKPHDYEHPPTPPERIDSKNLFISSTTKESQIPLTHNANETEI